MRKVRKKWLSILLTLAMLVGLMVPFAGSAVADTTYAEFTSGMKYISTGENKDAGTITVSAKKNWIGSEAYITLILPSGVTYKDKATALTNYVYAPPEVTGVTIDPDRTSKSRLGLKLDNPLSNGQYIQFTFGTGNAALTVDSSVTGDIKATVEVMGVQGSEILFLESATLTIARVTTAAVNITADTPANIQPGIGVNGAKITIEELSPRAIKGGKKVFIEVITSGAKFESAPSDWNFDGSVSERVYMTWTESTVLPKKVEVDLASKLTVSPQATGDIKVKVFGESGSNVPETILTVATIGTAAVSITDVKYNTGKVYAGYNNRQTPKVDDNPAEFTLKAAGGNIAADKVVVLELSVGKFDKTLPFVPENIKSGTSIQLYNDDKAAWFVTAGGVDKLKINNFNVVVPTDASEGDLVVKVSGTAGASGSVVIGKVVKPFTVSATAPSIPYLGQEQAAGDIYIKETAAGKILQAELYVELPEGITFAGTPKVKVTEGNLTIGTIEVTDNKKLKIPVTGTSSIPSTIRIYDIKYNVARSALEGDVSVSIKGETGTNKWDGKAIKVANATIVSPTARTAVFTLGSSVYTVNGVSYTMDVAAYEKNGRTYLPVRYVAYALGVDPENVYWDAATQTVTLLKGTNAVQLTIGSNVLKLNGISITMDVAPELVSGRTMLPFRFIAQALGATVSWDEATKTVTMNLQ